MNRPALVMIDDDPVFLQNYRRLLEDQYQVHTAETLSTGLRLIEQHHPEVLLLDIALQRQREGLEMLPIIRGRFPHLIIVMITADERYITGKEALCRGADEHFVKTESVSELKQKLELLREGRGYNQTIQLRFAEIEAIFVSPQMQELYRKLKQIAKTDFPVLLIGESGVGKEIAAQFIHVHSARGQASFVSVNCASIPESLFENEMFGHEAGAYTDARKRRMGRFEEANGGTLFLDEIEKLTISCQAALLRVIEEKRFYRLGSEREIGVDVRVIAAGTEALLERLESGEFLKELYYRICCEQFRIPPLRERREDIIPLARFFLKKHQSSQGKDKYFTEQALRLLKNGYWEGNIRELEHTVSRAIIRSGKRRDIRPIDLELEMETSPIVPYNQAKDRAMQEFRRDYVSRLLTHYRGNISAAARASGLSRQGLKKMMEELGLDINDYKA